VPLTVTDTFTVNVVQPSPGAQAVINGALQDGYIAGATVFMDTNGDGVHQSFEAQTTTDASGHFTLVGKPGQLIALGGPGAVDLATLLPFNGMFTAPTGSTVVSPLTTALSELMDFGFTLESAQIKLRAALNLASTVDITQIDPIAGMQSTDPIQKALAEHLFITASQIRNTVALLHAAAPNADPMHDIAAALSTGQPFDLSSHATVDALVAACGLTGTFATDVAAIVFDSNELLATKAQAPDVLQQLVGISAVSTVAQGEAAAALAQAFDDTTMQSVLLHFTGHGLAEAANVAEHHVGDVNGDGTVDAVSSTVCDQDPGTPPPVDPVGGGQDPGTPPPVDPVGGGQDPGTPPTDDHGGSSGGHGHDDTTSGGSTDDHGLGDPGTPPPVDPVGGSQDPGTTPPPVVADGSVLTGTPESDVLIGTAGPDNIVAFGGDDVAIGGSGDDAISAGDGNDFINGGAGRDVIFAGSGDDQVFGGQGADIIYGDAGADRIFGDEGDDLINAGAGDDTVFGGSGNDLFVAEIGDGNDVYYGDDGIDTLDMSAATVSVTVNLGTGPLEKGSATSTQTGNDVLWGIENVNTGSGDDTIIASNAVNVMDGGAGNDTFVFRSTTAANGDTILGFEPGDHIDLSGIDANTTTAGDQSFTLVTGAAFTAAGQLAVSFESGANGDFTIVRGNVDGNTNADFEIKLEGHHNLTNSDFNL
jgi:Ca2+-binding RTX toxin-like protein